MKTNLECIPCFFKQILEASRRVGISKTKQKLIIDKMAREIPKMSLNYSPPQMARVFNKLLQKETKNKDIYLQIKKTSNSLALEIYGQLKKKVQRSKDPLLTSIELAIAGNIIDFGARNSLDLSAELKKILNQENKTIKEESESLFNYAKFKQVLEGSKNILYLGDNAGETVFDRILIEELNKKKIEITYAVRDKPVINDALIQDAVDCGIDRIAQVVSSGVDTPGTVLALCSSEFLKIYKNADMVISKGQGNFEALSATKRPVLFLLMAKCSIIARHIGCELGDPILLYHKGS